MFFVSPDDVDFIRLHYRKNQPVSALDPMLLSYIDLTYCIKGELEYTYNGQPISLHAGDAILFLPGSVRVRKEGAVPSTYASFNVLLHTDQMPAVSGFLPKCTTAKVTYILEHFYEDFSGNTAQKKEKCTSVFLYLYHQLLEDFIYTDAPHIHSIKQYISQNLERPLPLKEIAAQIHLAPEYVCALFKKHTGQTLSRYIINQRIERAKILIITENAPLTRIAEKCGFRDYFYFSNTFRKMTGQSPAAYRKSIIAGSLPK